ncbi:MAG: DUF4198 domain-containing protein [Desulfovibrio sp.]|nr:DUF4198 domain-containing protein [Desulfovibrio sp.]
MRSLLTVFCAAALVLSAAVAHAHFGMVIPTKSAVEDKKDADITLTYAFAHPFEGKGMDLEIEKAQVFADGKATEMTAGLKPGKVMGKKGFTAAFKLARPGVYTFAMTPKPYWEPAEDKFIIHYTKTVVAAFGEEEGWAEPCGLPVEIVPLTRPFASYAGGVFRGKVLHNGKPVADCDVEVEYYNGTKGKYSAPNDYFVTQVVRTDANGVFCANVPFAGWWGFAALVDGPDKMAFEGKDRDVELGGVIWTEFTAPVKAGK